MEDALAFSGSDRIQHLLVTVINLDRIRIAVIVIINVIDIDPHAVVLLHKGNGILDHGKRPKSEEIHF